MRNPELFSPGQGPDDPVESTIAAAPVEGEIASGTRLGPVRLSVASLPRSVEYYTGVIGLQLQHRDDASATLGAGGDPLLMLREAPGAAPWPKQHAGLYHVAFLLPERSDLARWLAHAMREEIALTGMSDHFVSEALYLRDPDHHGIEIYWDRPRSVWEGQVADRLTTQRLPVGDLLRTLSDPIGEPFEGFPAGTTIGHVHLCVDDLAAATAFYARELGFGVMAQVGAAAFYGAGGYHHHVAANVWESLGQPQAPAEIAQLQEVTILLPDAHALAAAVERLQSAGRSLAQDADGVRLSDPAGTPLLLAVAPAPAGPLSPG